MITLTEIKNFYSSDISKFDRSILREYLQYLILSIIFTHKLGSKLSFIGGTCLRIVYGSQRFSEVIDFDNKNLSALEFAILSEYIKKELEKYGFIVEIKIIKKGAFHCKIKFSDILQENSLSPISEEKILIQVDTFDQQFEYQTETFILNKFDITKPIIITPKPVILAQKLWTITQRERAKGRDFYDIIYLLQTTKPYQEFLFAKFNTKSLKEVKANILQYISKLDLDLLANDVKPFLINATDTDKIKYFKQLFEQTSLD
jgi:predicted nucleotidyltransferase component of viral defense system